MSTVQVLNHILHRLETIEAQLAERPVAHDDALNAFGLIAQLVEVYGEQRDAVRDLITRLDAHDTAIQALLAALVPSSDVRQSIQDTFDTLGIVVQLKEVETHQRDTLAMLVGLAAELLTEARAESKAGTDQRQDNHQLMVQLRELGRKMVAGLFDVQQTVEQQGEDRRSEE